MKPTRSQIEQALRRLKETRETSTDLVQARVAQAMEEAIRWATEKTKGWSSPDEMVRQYAALIRADEKRANSVTSR